MASSTLLSADKVHSECVSMLRAIRADPGYESLHRNFMWCKFNSFDTGIRPVMWYTSMGTCNYFDWFGEFSNSRGLCRRAIASLLHAKGMPDEVACFFNTLTYVPDELWISFCCDQDKQDHQEMRFICIEYNDLMQLLENSNTCQDIDTGLQNLMFFVSGREVFIGRELRDGFKIYDKPGFSPY